MKIAHSLRPLFQTPVNCRDFRSSTNLRRTSASAKNNRKRRGVDCSCCVHDGGSKTAKQCKCLAAVFKSSNFLLAPNFRHGVHLLRSLPCSWALTGNPFLSSLAFSLSSGAIRFVLNGISDEIYLSLDYRLANWATSPASELY
jgi:hypothetical protein